MTKPHIKLFIPGPVEVSEDTFQAMSQPMIGHRGSGFQDLYAALQPKLHKLLYTKNPVFLSINGSMSASAVASKPRRSRLSGDSQSCRKWSTRN